jgi:hypothetical protein
MDTIDPEVRADIEYAARLLERAVARRQRADLQVGRLPTVAAIGRRVHAKRWAAACACNTLLGRCGWERVGILAPGGRPGWAGTLVWAGWEACCRAAACEQGHLLLPCDRDCVSLGCTVPCLPASQDSATSAAPEGARTGGSAAYGQSAGGELDAAGFVSLMEDVLARTKGEPGCLAGCLAGCQAG